MRQKEEQKEELYRNSVDLMRFELIKTAESCLSELNKLDEIVDEEVGYLCEIIDELRVLPMTCDTEVFKYLYGINIICERLKNDFFMQGRSGTARVELCKARELLNICKKKASFDRRALPMTEQCDEDVLSRIDAEYRFLKSQYERKNEHKDDDVEKDRGDLSYIFEGDEWFEIVTARVIETLSVLETEKKEFERELEALQREVNPTPEQNKRRRFLVVALEKNKTELESCRSELKDLKVSFAHLERIRGAKQTTELHEAIKRVLEKNGGKDEDIWLLKERLKEMKTDIDTTKKRDKEIEEAVDRLISEEDNEG